MENDSLEYLDIQDKKEKFEELISFLINKIDYTSEEFYYRNNENKHIKLRFNKLQLQVEDDIKKYRTHAVAENISRIFFIEFPQKLKIITDEINSQLRDMSNTMSEVYQRLIGYEEEIEELRTELDNKDNKIEELKTLLEDEKSNNINIRLNTIESHMRMRDNNTSPDNFFDSDINDNILKENNIYEDEEDIKEDTEIIEESNLTKNDRIQNAHTYILEFMKEQELYPIHKINPSIAKLEYENVWNKICFKEEYELEIRDIPKFIFQLDKYIDKDENYLDNIKGVE